jgi:hypothetical protein
MPEKMTRYISFIDGYSLPATVTSASSAPEASASSAPEASAPAAVKASASTAAAKAYATKATTAAASIEATASTKKVTSTAKNSAIHIYFLHCLLFVFILDWKEL